MQRGALVFKNRVVMTAYTLSGSDIVHENFGGDLVVLNLSSGQYFGLNPTAAALWTAIVDGKSTSDITGDAEVVAGFVARLSELGLIVPTDVAHPTSEPVAFEGMPQIDVYDDLSDLIVADPIHDVDAEAGWPKMPEDQTAAQ